MRTRIAVILLGDRLPIKSNIDTQNYQYIYFGLGTGK
jgi:hypothetical protein